MSAKQKENAPAGQGERVQKVLAQAGLGSRRTVEQWIASGRVSINGVTAAPGMKIGASDVVRVDDRIVHLHARGGQLPRILLYHKPEGEIVSRSDPEMRLTVFDRLPQLRGMKWIAVGRLDFNTSGLLVFTTSGELAHRLMHPRFEAEREYAVRVQGSLTAVQMKQLLRDGIMLDDGPVKFSRLEDAGGQGHNHWYRVVLNEGRNRIVRRTFEVLGVPVSRLMRVRFGMIALPSRLKRGTMIELGADEVAAVLNWAGLKTVPSSDAAPRPAPRRMRSRPAQNQ